jgi:hypothetical protein
MINRWCLGMEGVPAKVHEGESWLDGNPSLILDYRGSSKLIWRNAREAAAGAVLHSGERVLREV